jgi:predicted ABC-type ATPase
MNDEQIIQIIDFDRQLITFCRNMHKAMLQYSEKGSQITAELIAGAQKLGDFVHEARKEGFSITPTEAVN